MKKVIAKILREQWDEEETPIPEKMLQRYFKFIDRVGIKIALPLLGLEDDEKKAEVLVKYYRESNNPKEEYIPINFSPSETSKLFEDRDYNLEELVEGYLTGNYDYDFHYDCYDYDHNWMWDDISNENQKYILGKAKEAGVDMDDEDYVVGFIEEEYGWDIGCAWGDAQNDADIGILHKDIFETVEDFYSKFDGEWDFDAGVYKGKISTVDLTQSTVFGDVIVDHLEYNNNIDWVGIMEGVIEYEMDNIGYDSVLFDEKPYIDTDKHFRYGGAGDMDKDYMNDILKDRFTEWD